MAGLLPDIPGIDPETLKQLQGLLGMVAPQESDKAQQRKDDLMRFGLGLMMAKKGNEWATIGQSGLNTLQQHNADLSQMQTQRGQNLTQAAGLLGIARQNQKLQSDASFIRDMQGGGGTETPPVQLPAAPYAGQGMGDRGLGSISPPSQAQIPGGRVGENPLVKELRDYGASDSQIGLALQSDNPRASVATLLEKLKTPHFGQGKVPILPGRNGSYHAVLPEGAAEGAATMAGATTNAEEQAKAQYDLVDVPVGNNQTQKMTRADAVKFLAQQRPDLAGDNRPVAPLTPQQQQLAAADAARNGRPYFDAARGPGPGLGGPGVTASPLAIRQAEQNITTQGAQDTDIAKTFGNDYADTVKAEKLAPANIQKFEHLKQTWAKVNTGPLAPTVQSLKSIAAYVAPDLAKSWTADVPYYQAAQALSNAMALELRNPSGGAGMPGSLSDSDRKYLQSMISSAENNPAAIPMILDAKIALENRNRDLGKIAREYRVGTGKVDEGLYQQFQNYADTHPLFKDAPLPAAAPAQAPTKHWVFDGKKMVLQQ